MALFGVVFNGKYFTKSSIILFLNKVDIFEEKLKRVPIKKYFNSFEGKHFDSRQSVTFFLISGDNSRSDGVRFFRRRFVKELKDVTVQRRVYVHETCAISDQVQLVINTVIDNVVQENLKDTGMI